MYPKNKAQIYKNSNPAVRCEIFSCFDSATRVVGRPDGPRSLAVNLCERCYQSIVDSLIINEGERLLERKLELEHEEAVRKEKETYGGREFTCQTCGEVYYSPQRLGICVREHNRADRQAAEQEMLEKAKAEKEGAEVGA